jgi:hypothetical protein
MFHLRVPSAARLDAPPPSSHQRDHRQAGQQRGAGERRRETVFVLQHLDVQRQGVGLAANVPETTETAPNSPIARALQRMMP